MEDKMRKNISEYYRKGLPRFWFEGEEEGRSRDPPAGGA